MFNFDSSKYRFGRFRLKSISKSTVAPKVEYLDECGVLCKVEVPVAIARRIKMRLNDVTRFVDYFPCDLGFVGKRLVAMDVPDRPQYKVYKETGKWESFLAENSKVIENLAGDWLFDGQYVYKFTGPMESIEGSAFASRACNCYNLYQFGEKGGTATEDLIAFGYKDPDTGKYTSTGPATRSTGNLLMLTGDSKNADAPPVGRALDRIDRNIFVNLRFVTYTAQAINDKFGYKFIEPLGIPLLIMEHRTFNIGGLATQVQHASPAPMKFTEALAWLIGMFRHVEELDQMIAIKQSMKMLLTKGNTNHLASTVKKDEKEVGTKELIESLRTKMEAAPLITFDL